MSAARIPPIQCLLTFEALARLRSVTQAAEEQCVTPSAVSHRVRQLEQIIGTKLFGRADFSLTTEGSEYLAHVRDGLSSLQKFPSSAAAPGKRKLRVAVTPTFSRSIVIPRLRQFTEAYPEIDLTLQVSIPLLDVVAEDADLVVRFGPGRYADMEYVCLTKDEVAPLASPAFVREHGPFDVAQDLEGVQQQGVPQALAAGAGVHGEVFEVGAGPAVGHADYTVAVAGDKTQLRVIFGVGGKACLPGGEVGHRLAIALVAEAQQCVYSAGQFRAVGAQVHAHRPLRRRQRPAQVAAQQQGGQAQ